MASPRAREPREAFSVTRTQRLKERPRGTGSQTSEEVALSCDSSRQLWQCGKGLGTPQLSPREVLPHGKASQTFLPCPGILPVGRTGAGDKAEPEWGESAPSITKHRKEELV